MNRLERILLERRVREERIKKATNEIDRIHPTTPCNKVAFHARFPNPEYDIDDIEVSLHIIPSESEKGVPFLFFDILVGSSRADFLVPIGEAIKIRDYLDYILSTEDL